MSQRVVESILGRLITDAEFRRRFFVEPAMVCRTNGLDLTSAELAALLRLESPALQSVAVRLDPKIVRALTVSSNGRDRTPTALPARQLRAAGRSATRGSGQ